MFWMALAIMAFVSWHTATRYSKYLENVVSSVQVRLDSMVTECERCLRESHRLIGFGHKVEGKLEAMKKQLESLRAEAERLCVITSELQNPAKNHAGKASQDAVNEILGRR